VHDVPNPGPQLVVSAQAAGDDPARLRGRLHARPPAGPWSREEAHLRAGVRTLAHHVPDLVVRQQGDPAALADPMHRDASFPTLGEHGAQRLGPLDARDLDAVLAAVGEPPG
jgi:hypothetical protein